MRRWAAGGFCSGQPLPVPERRIAWAALSAGSARPGKLVRCVEGEVFDVAVDIRRSSPTFGKWVGAVLSAENKRQLWIPEGFAHGFMALSDTVQFVYKATNYYAPQSERSIIWNDPEIGIDWPALSDCALAVGERSAGTYSCHCRSI